MKYLITQAGAEAVVFMNLVDEVYNLAVNEGVIKTAMTDEEKIEWFNRGRDEAKDAIV